MQARYQYGSLTRRTRRKGPDVWQWRYSENGFRKAIVLGTVEQLPTQADAERAAEPFRVRVNSQNPEQVVTVAALVGRFAEQCIPKRCRRSTQKLYASILKNHILPIWGKEPVRAVKPMAVEGWLENYPHSRQIKRHIRALMHNVFQAALRWEMLERNPISLVRQSSTRLKKPRALTPAEFRGLLGELTEPYRTMVLTVACLGLRVCELIGLQWADVDFESMTVNICRSVVEGEVNLTKNESSEAALPLDPDLATALLEHRRRAVYVADDDWVFASDIGKPRWPDSMLADHIKPAAARAGVGKIGWHTFRHTCSTMLAALGTKPAVQKELLRHADIQTTMNIYTQAISEDKREAASKLARELLK